MMKIYAGRYDENGRWTEEGRAITQQDMDDIARFMNDDIREELHRELAPCSPDEFIRAYLQRDPDFVNVLEETFRWEDDEDAEDPEEFVRELFDSTSDTEAACTLYDEDTAEEDLRHFRREWDNVPKLLTAAELMEMWNDMVLASYESVRVLNGSGNLVSVPRHTQMTDKQIAKAIKKASDWSEVSDLVDYIDEEYLHIEKDDDGYFQGDWERIIEDWCDEQ